MTEMKSTQSGMSRRDLLLLAGAAVLGNAIPSEAGPPLELPVQGDLGRGTPPSNIPPVPVWTRELKEIGPGVFVYTQPGGPGIPNLGLRMPAALSAAIIGWRSIR